MGREVILLYTCSNMLICILYIQYVCAEHTRPKIGQECEGGELWVGESEYLRWVMGSPWGGSGIGRV
jgi:hypothetical protein